MLGCVAPRIELQAEEHVDGSLLAVRMEVKLEIDLGSCSDVTARPFTEYIRAFSNGILIEEDTLLCRLQVYIPVNRTTVDAGISGFHHRCSDVVDIRITLEGNNLNRLDKAVFDEAGIDYDVRPPIGRLGLHNQILWKTDNEIRLANLPRVLIRKLTGRRNIGGISLGSAGVYPLDDGCDFLIRQGDVIVEMLETHILVNEPGRHLPSHPFPLDRLRPRPYLIISQQRHRRDGALTVTDLAMILKNWRDILRERQLLLRHCWRRHCCRSHDNHQNGEGCLHRHKSPLHFLSLL